LDGAHGRRPRHSRSLGRPDDFRGLPPLAGSAMRPYPLTQDPSHRISMPKQQSVIVRVEADIRAIDAAAWDACANPRGVPYNPFISHAFLASLEESGSAGAETGWLPQHLIRDDGSGGVAGALACYLKNRSQGEYVFDYGWADAYERAGGRYYPKLQAS